MPHEQRACGNPDAPGLRRPSLGQGRPAGSHRIRQTTDLPARTQHVTTSPDPRRPDDMAAPASWTGTAEAIRSGPAGRSSDQASPLRRDRRTRPLQDGRGHEALRFHGLAPVDSVLLREAPTAGPSAAASLHRLPVVLPCHRGPTANDLYRYKNMMEGVEYSHSLNTRQNKR